jgi:isoleucyl-tRNA synthetase
VTRSWSGYEPTAGVRALIDFVVDDLSNWYVRINRERFWAPDGQADAAAVATLRESLVMVSRLLAPACPFSSDWLHRALAGTSVHLAGWPESPRAADPALDEAMGAVRRLASLARAARESGKIRVRQPLGRLGIAVPASVRGPVLDRLLPILQAEVNVKEIVVAASDLELVQLKAKPNFRSLGKRFGKETQLIAQAVTQLTADQIRALEAGGQVTADVNGRPIVYFSEDIVVEREVAIDWLVASDGPFVAALDPVLTSELIQEGLAREIVHYVQRLRREAGYAVADRVALGVSGAEAIVETAKQYRAFIVGETLARQFEIGGSVPHADLTSEVEIDGHAVTLSLRRHEAGA